MSDGQIAHLEFIQNNIIRMNQNSFQMKGWMLTIVSALLALFAASYDGDGNGNIVFLLVAVFPTVIFWLLDSYYLQQERKFRGLYCDIPQSEVKQINPFAIQLSKYTGGKYSFVRAVFSKTEWPLYLPAAIGLVIGWLCL